MQVREKVDGGGARDSMRPLDTLPPTEVLEIGNDLSLVPRLKLNLTVFPTVRSVARPIDVWQLKRALTDFLKNSLSVSLTVPEEDIQIRRVRDLKQRKHDDPVATGALFVRDLGFLKSRKRSGDDGEEEDFKVLEKKFLDWRKYIVEKMDGIELNLEGVKYRLTVQIPESDDFEKMMKDWEESCAFENRGYSRGRKQEPDTIVLRGAPSRWFAETRVSSKPSMLVTHSIFSTFGSIRSLKVAVDADFNKDADDDAGLVSGLYCKIVVQFEKYQDYYNVLKVLCTRSLQKQGSRMRADYEVTWEKDGLFRDSRIEMQMKTDRILRMPEERYKNDIRRREPPGTQFSDDSRRKRFKDQ